MTVLDLEAHLKASGTVLPVVSYHSSTRERDSVFVSIYMHALINLAGVFTVGCHKYELWCCTAKKLVFTDHESCTKPGLNFKISRCFIKRKPHVNLVKGYIGIGTITDIRNPLLIMIFPRFPHVIPIKILVQNLIMK